LLLLLIAGEAVVGVVLVGQRLMQPRPPEVDWALFDPITADEFRAAVARCESAQDWRALGELYMATGCFPQAELCHRIACELAPRDATLARQWAFALERLALLDEANVQYRRAIDLKQADPDACRYFIGRNLLRAEKPDQARAIFEEGRALPANRYELARLHLRAGELAQAAAILDGLSANRPGALQPHLLGYRVQLEREDGRRAFTHADRARYAPQKLHNPFDEEAQRIVKVTQTLGANRHWKEGRDLIEAGRLDDARTMLREAGRVFDSSAVTELLAEVALRQHRFGEAVELLEEFEARHGATARIAARVGDVWAAAGDAAKARASWLRAVQLAAGLDMQSTHYKLAMSLGAMGNEGEAQRHLGLAHYFVGRALVQAGRPAEAADLFSTAVKHDAKLVQAWFYLGEAQRLAGQERSAASAYEKCLELNPHHGRAHASLAFLADGRRD
jgi:tetratricopeptide (TPR) repeat protein